MSSFSTPPAQDAADITSVTDDFALVDSHCHLDFFLDSSDRGSRDSDRGGRKLPRLEEVLTRAYRANVRTLLTIATDFSQRSTLLSLCENYDPRARAPKIATTSTNSSSSSDDNNPRLFCSAGTHPTNLSEEVAIPSPEQLVAAHKSSPSRVIAFGESGLDFFRSSNPPMSLQYASFRNHILAAQEAQVPLVIHNRNADLELERVLLETQSQKAYPCILHCFSGSERLAKVALELDCMLSFAGLATYPSARALEAVIDNTPLTNLLIETDSPFLPPQDNSLLGKKKRRAAYCEPAMLRVTAEHIASLKGLSLRELATATRGNFASLFDLTTDPES